MQWLTFGEESGSGFLAKLPLSAIGFDDHYQSQAFALDVEATPSPAGYQQSSLHSNEPILITLRGPLPGLGNILDD
jgi:hypothetical protein